MGLAGSGAGSQWRGSIPIPPASLRAPGLCATHIVGVIILVVGQLHHPVGALERGTAMGNQLRTVKKKKKQTPQHQTGLQAPLQTQPHGDPTELVGDTGSSRVYGLASHHQQRKASNAPFHGREGEWGILIIIFLKYTI